MSDPQSNPFEAFQVADNSATAEHGQLLAQTQPWLILMGALTLVGAVFMVMASLAMGAMGAMGLAVGEDDPAAAVFGGGFMVFGLVLYGAMAALYGGFAWFMLKQAIAIGRFRKEGGLDPLADVLRAHRDFWRLSGISVLTIMVLYCGGIGAMVMFGAMGAAALGQ